MAESKRKSLYAAVKNKDIIAEALLNQINKIGEDHGPLRLLEIASGTGEHANCILSKTHRLLYQPTELDSEMMESIAAWTEEFPQNVKSPILLDVNTFDNTAVPDQLQELLGNTDIILCINMIHISPWSSTQNLFKLAGQFLKTNGFVMTYGAYRVNGTMVESNVAFDASLKSRNPEWGVRDLEKVEEVALQHGLRIKEVHEVPSNNLVVIFVRE